MIFVEFTNNSTFYAASIVDELIYKHNDEISFLHLLVVFHHEDNLMWNYQPDNIMTGDACHINTLNNGETWMNRCISGVINWSLNFRERDNFIQLSRFGSDWLCIQNK